jgi:hypothetical protein
VAVPDPEHLVVVSALGVAVGIQAPDAETATRLRRQWSRAQTTLPPDVHVDTAQLAGLEPDQHDYAVTVRVTMRALEATAGTRLNIHAGAVADDEGRTLAVVGASGMGKTTAIRALATRLGYLSDETVSLTTDLTVHPHPKPLSVITDPALPTRKASVSPDDAGLRKPPGQATLRRLVLLRRGHGTAGLVPVSTPEAIVEVVPQTSSLALLDDPLLRLSRAIDQCGGALALHYDEVADHLDDLVELLASEREEPWPAVHHPSVAPGVATPDQWSRSPWLDAVQYDEELVVMAEGTAHLLGGLGTTVWLALATPATVTELVAVAEAEHGPHPDARDLVDAALSQLSRSRLVVSPG